jgi:hypothetical protein
MNRTLRRARWWISTSAGFSLIGVLACSGADEGDGAALGTGGVADATGGSGVGGAVVASGGATSGGAFSGGAPSSGSSSGSGGAYASGGEASGGAGGAGTGGAGTGEPVFHVFLLLGQSNMAGYPKAVAADKVEDPRIKVLGFDACGPTGRAEGIWDTAAPPLHECWNGAIGPGDYFSKTILNHYPNQDTVGLVPSAISGEKIETFMKVGGAKYNWILARAKAAQNAGGVIEGILFHQGESNCGDPAWPGKVKTLVSDLRADLGLGSVPFLAGELLYSGSCAKHNSLVNQLPSLLTNAHIVSAQGLAMDPADEWNLHFAHDAQVTLGTRYADKMISVLGL